MTDRRLRHVGKDRPVALVSNPEADEGSRQRDDLSDQDSPRF
ncbi:MULTISPECIES: hypothetical protein [unclassified Streptomyces]|nr:MULTISPECIES: hypothetical protein [unclassified Streptomyces]WSP53748.1 hypothetical protein OG306_04630 [Streptomyces sp. NBC_01241]WSU25583.1 hypothetical protein OG508_34735 [Streptomyces sp. NBC_01108]MCX4785151.1 hypothetical protein [Streptomyces sp. NBC_01221]MCX4798908.1 hypothetical protein [Streptomyces sp. NBC_01242]WSJ40108.1 hypothetical protein OG772_31695 [Streptomyces sp. NBC_01321]